MDRKGEKTTIVNSPGLIWPLRHWDTWAFSGTPFDALCVCLSFHMCKDEDLITLIPDSEIGYCRCVIPDEYASVCVFKRKKQLYACVQSQISCITSLFIRALFAWCWHNKQELICDIHTRQLNKSICGTWWQPAAHPELNFQSTAPWLLWLFLKRVWSDLSWIKIYREGKIICALNIFWRTSWTWNRFRALSFCCYPAVTSPKLLRFEH